MPSSVTVNLLDDGVVDTLGMVGATSGVHTSVSIDASDSARIPWRSTSPSCSSRSLSTNTCDARRRVPTSAGSCSELDEAAHGTSLTIVMDTRRYFRFLSPRVKMLAAGIRSTTSGGPTSRPTRGRCGSLLLHRVGLLPTTPRKSPGVQRFELLPQILSLVLDQRPESRFTKAASTLVLTADVLGAFLGKSRVLARNDLDRLTSSNHRWLRIEPTMPMRTQCGHFGFSLPAHSTK